MEDTWLKTRWRCSACCTSSASTTPDCPLLFAFTWSLRSCLMRAVSSFLAARITLKDYVHHVCACMLVCEYVNFTQVMRLVSVNVMNDRTATNYVGQTSPQLRTWDPRVPSNRALKQLLSALSLRFTASARHSDSTFVQFQCNV